MLFLIPWPWLGPWIAPVLVAAVLVIWGARTLLSSSAAPPLTRGASIVCAIGVAFVIAAFLLAGVPFVAGAVPEEGYRPQTFYWGVFTFGYAVMTAGLFVKASPKVPLGV